MPAASRSCRSCGKNQWVPGVCVSWPNLSLKESEMDQKIYNVLFVCSVSSDRSIRAEVIMNHLELRQLRDA